MRLRVHSGEFVAFSENDVTLRVAGNTSVVPKDDVYRVNVIGRGRGRHMKRGLLIGAAIGAGIGAGVGAAAYRSDYGGSVVAAAVAGGAGWGGGIGTLIGAGKQPRLPIYRAKAKPKQ